MKNLDIPEALKIEFATVEMLLNTTAKTSRVDAFVLSWVKYEKQLRRLFSFFVYQHPKITEDQLDDVIRTFSEDRNLKPEIFIVGIEKLGITPIPQLLGDTYTKLWPEIERIKKYRNKIMHGLPTGQHIESSQLESDIEYIISWIDAVSKKSDEVYGYDGLRRNTYIAAKSSSNIAIENYPFSTPIELKQWLSKLTN